MSGGHLGQFGIMTAPGVVEQIGPGAADRLADLVPPGVTLMISCGWAARTAVTSSAVRSISSATLTGSPGAALTPPMSTMSDALRHEIVDPRQRGLEGERGALGRRRSPGSG